MLVFLIEHFTPLSCRIIIVGTTLCAPLILHTDVEEAARLALSTPVELTPEVRRFNWFYTPIKFSFHRSSNVVQITLWKENVESIQLDLPTQFFLGLARAG